MPRRREGATLALPAVQRSAHGGTRRGPLTVVCHPFPGLRLAGVIARPLDSCHRRTHRRNTGPSHASARYGMLTAAGIKVRARELGVDLYGIAPAAGFRELRVLLEWLDELVPESEYAMRASEKEPLES